MSLAQPTMLQIHSTLCLRCSSVPEWILKETLFFVSRTRVILKFTLLKYEFKIFYLLLEVLCSFPCCWTCVCYITVHILPLGLIIVLSPRLWFVYMNVQTVLLGHKIFIINLCEWSARQDYTVAHCTSFCGRQYAPSFRFSDT